MRARAKKIMQQPKKTLQDNDITFPNPPSDGINCLSVNGLNANSTMLVAGSWDNTLSMYELQYGQNNGVITNIIKHQQLQHEGPVFCSDIGPDGVTTFSGGADGNVRMWNATQPTSSAQIVGKHDQPIRHMKYSPEMNVLVTGSWDKTVRMWDCRSPNPAAVIPMSDRVYAMDVKNQMIVIATADKNFTVFQGNNKLAEYKSPVNYQIRCVSIFADIQGFAIGTIEGRIGLEYFNEMNIRMQAQQKPNAPKPSGLKSFAYKCHRDNKDIFSVNSIDFHPNNTFCSAGSDGLFSIWDKESRSRVSAFELHVKRCPVNCVKFNPSGSYLFYAMSYDWSRGAENFQASMGNNICAHPIIESDVVRKK